MNIVNIKKESLFGFNISVFSKKELEIYILESLDSRNSRTYYGYSLGIIALMNKYPEIYNYCNNFDLLVTDGRLFYLLAKIKGINLTYDISIPNLVFLVLEIANKKKSSVMILGSTEKINYEASMNIKNKFENITILPGLTGGKFIEDEFPAIIEHVNRYKPEVILIGVSSPKKEKFAKVCSAKLDTSIIIPCGVVVDILAGKVKKIPKIIKLFGLASLWRIIQEPTRLYRRYFFLYKVIFFDLLFKFSLKSKDYFYPDNFLRK